MLKVSGHYLDFSQRKESCERLLWILTLLFPATVALEHGVSSVFLLMFLLSIYMLIQSRPRLNNMAKYMLAGFIVLILVSLLSMINADDVDNGIRRIKKLTTFIFLIPIFMAMVSVKTNLIKPFLIGACIGGFILLGLTIYQGYYLGNVRTSGFYNEIIFGSIAVIMAQALFVSLLFIRHKKIHLAVITLSLFSALYATILSGTRGAWVALIVGVPLALFMVSIKGQMPKKRIVLVLLLSILVASIAGILSKDELTSRWNTTVQNIDSYQSGSNRDTSIGIRLIMWEAAIKIWNRNPIIGTGIGDFQKNYEKMIKSGEFPGMRKTPYAYAHSTIFEALAGTGILGLIGLIVFTFFLPIVFFLKALRSSINEHDRYASVSGLVFVTAFAIFGLTENWLVHSQLVTTFSLLLVIMASRFGAAPR